MKLSTPFALLAVAVGVAQAAIPHAEHGIADTVRHARLGNHRRIHHDAPVERRDDNKKCRARSAVSCSVESCKLLCS